MWHRLRGFEALSCKVYLRQFAMRSLKQRKDNTGLCAQFPEDIEVRCNSEISLWVGTLLLIEQEYANEKQKTKNKKTKNKTAQITKGKEQCLTINHWFQLSYFFFRSIQNINCIQKKEQMSWSHLQNWFIQHGHRIYSLSLHLLFILIASILNMLKRLTWITFRAVSCYTRTSVLKYSE